MSMLNQSFVHGGQSPVPFAANPTSSPDVYRSLPLNGVPSNSFKSSHPPQSLLFKNPVQPDLLRDVRELGLFSPSSMENLLNSSATTTTTVFVSSAVELERKQIDKIARKMQRMTGVKDLRVENVIDQTLIAGLVIRYGDDEGRPKVIDLSVKGHLAELADRIATSEKNADELERSWGLIYCNH